jgi:Flp pilus assembly protein TadG
LSRKEKKAPVSLSGPVQSTEGEIIMNSRHFTERGQALILIAFAAIALFGITGLAIDGSNKYSDRRHAQNAADTAVLAGALARANTLTNNPGLSDAEVCPSASPGALCQAISNAALDRAANNGYDDNLVTNEVKVYTCNHPDSDCGPYAGNKNYLKVIITSTVDTYFLRVLGINQSQNVVSAVALAGKGGKLGDGAMLISYDPSPNCSTGGTGGSSVSVEGSTTINLNGGGIFVNSNAVCGFKIPNCADLNITGGGINSVGANNIDQDGCAEQAPENPNQDPVDIPDEVIWPDVPPECGIAPTADYLGVDPHDGKGEWLIHPGYYEVFPQATLVSNKQHIYMASGVYCIDPGGPSHDFDLSWSPVDFVTLNGSTDPSKNKYHAYNPDGVTLYIKSGGGFSINANNPTYLDASTTGDYQGYLIILEGNRSSIENCSISGGADIDINGMIFAPYCNITVNGDSSSVAEINAQLIGWDLKINGGAGINFNYDPNNAVKIKRRVGLMK